MKLVFKVFLGVMAFLMVILLFNYFRFSATLLPKGFVQKTTKIDQSNVDKKLSGAIKINTTSLEGVPPDSLIWKQFHAYLQQNFPMCFSKMTLINFGPSLMMTLAGDSTKKPVVFLAHMDVVPAEGDQASQWQEPPFSGNIKDGLIWGRGALDDKIAVIALLESMEMLLKTSKKPLRPIVFCFGHDEEIGGINGAQKMALFLKNKNTDPLLVLDEGLFVVEDMVPGIAEKVGLIGVAEKGYASFALKINSNGGHSSMPLDSNSILVLSDIVSKINPKVSSLQLGHLVESFWDCVGPEMNFGMKMIFANRWLFKPLVIGAYQKKPSSNALIRTTFSPTVFSSGKKYNVIPSESYAVVNARIHPNQSIAEVKKDLQAITGLNDLQLTLLPDANEASEVSSTDNSAYYALVETIEKTFQPKVVAPSLMIAGTDAKYYSDWCDRVYRFLPVVMDKNSVKKLHGKDENISVHQLKRAVEFYYTLFHALDQIPE